MTQEWSWVFVKSAIYIYIYNWHAFRVNTWQQNTRSIYHINYKTLCNLSLQNKVDVHSSVVGFNLATWPLQRCLITHGIQQSKCSGISTHTFGRGLYHTWMSITSIVTMVCFLVGPVFFFLFSPMCLLMMPCIFNCNHHPCHGEDPHTLKLFSSQRWMWTDHNDMHNRKWESHVHIWWCFLCTLPMEHT